MAMYLGEDKVASLGSICNVSGSASKNLYDKDNLCIGYNVNSSTGELETNAVYNATNFIKVNGTITVSFSGKTGNYNKIFVGEYDENKNFITRQTNATTTSLQYQFTLNDNTKYIRFSHRNDAGITNVQIEKGSTATEYEEYYEPTISVKDSNGAFREVEINEDNYSLGEQIIGTWIDGKPLYRKMVDFGSLPSNATLDIAHNIANVEHMHVNIGETLWCLNSQSYTGQGQIFSPVFTNYISSIYADNTYISVKTIAPDANVFKMLMCLEYTKN